MAESDASAEEAAKWLAEKLAKDGELYQNEAVVEVEKLFGKDLVYINDNGNQAISAKVLKNFRALTEKEAVWDRWDKKWRKREASDDPNKRGID